MRMPFVVNLENGGQAKREIKKAKRFCNEYLTYTPVRKANPRKKDKKLYDIETREVEKINKRLKIHYVGYSTCFDEWRLSGLMEDLDIFRLSQRKAVHSITCL